MSCQNVALLRAQQYDRPEDSKEGDREREIERERKRVREREREKLSADHRDGGKQSSIA